MLTWGICFGSMKHWRTLKDLNSLGTSEQAAFMSPLTLSKPKIVYILKVVAIEFAIINLCYVHTNKLKC